MPSKTQKSKYKIVLESNGLWVLGSLFFIAATLVFYLGVSYGKSTRNAATSQFTTKANSLPASLETSDKLAVLNMEADSVNEYEKKLNLVDRSIDGLSKIFAKEPAPIADKKESQSLINELTAAKLAEQSALVVPSSNKQKSFTIQIASMKNHDHAKLLLQKLRESGFEAYILTTPSAGDVLLYKVRVGSQLSEQAAKGLLPALEEKFAGLTLPAIKEYGKP